MNLHRLDSDVRVGGEPKGAMAPSLPARSVRAERDRLQRLFNRLEAAISHHKRETDKPVGFADVHDEALYRARDKVLRDAHEGKG